jgi:hypothetical protein
VPANKEKVRKAAGRPKDSTNKAKLKKNQDIIDATTEIAQMYKELRNKTTKKNLPNGALDELIKTTLTSKNLPLDSVNREAILSRYRRNNLTGISKHRQSPLLEIEPLIVEWCLKMAKIGMALNRENVIDLTSELIQGTEFEKKFKDFKKVRYIDGKRTNGEKFQVGKTWYNGFMLRNKEALRRGKCKVRDIKRHTWCTYENFRNMYDCVYLSMVESGVAEELSEAVMYDVNGEVTTNVDEMYGRPSKYRMVKPENLVFVDETGCNTNQKDDGYAGGEQFVLPRVPDESGLVGATTDIHFTVLCFTSGTGEPILCAVILKSNKDIKDIPVCWKLGIDIRKNVETGRTEAETIQLNHGEGKAYPSGPTCTYQGKVLPCFVGSSPNASITSELLAAMLQSIDSHDVFDRSNGNKPFLLLDGHHSRLKLPFLRYINDDNHPWTVCLGVPYGTHLWQAF